MRDHTVPALAAALLMLGFICTGTLARAGGGPENVFLVVNERSWGSKTIANNYSILRRIPASNILYLDWSGSTLSKLPVDVLRDELLTPILAAIETRGLSQQIDYIIYSADYPYLFDVSGDLSGEKPAPPLVDAGSLTGLTYLADLVRAKDPNYIQLNINTYMRRPNEQATDIPSQAFRRAYRWGPRGELLECG
jgi:hypothetical protein